MFCTSHCQREPSLPKSHQPEGSDTVRLFTLEQGGGRKKLRRITKAPEPRGNFQVQRTALKFCVPPRMWYYMY
jgi:hypothetical protein